MGTLRWQWGWRERGVSGIRARFHPQLSSIILDWRISVWRDMQHDQTEMRQRDVRNAQGVVRSPLDTDAVHSCVTQTVDPAARSRRGSLHLGVSLRRFAYVTASFPLCTLSACFLYSVAFSYSIVNTTICKVSAYFEYQLSSSCGQYRRLHYLYLRQDVTLVTLWKTQLTTLAVLFLVNA